MHATVGEANVFDLANIMVRDLDDRIVLWNTGAERLYGWARQEAEGRVSHDLLRTQFPRPLSEIKRQLYATGRWQGKLLHTRKDGSTVAVASQWAVDRDERGRPVGILEVNNDITDLNRAEERLRQSEEKFRATFEQAAVGLAHVAPDGRWLRVNHRLRELLGYPGDQLLELKFQDITHPEDLDADLCQLRKLLAGQISTYTLDKRYVRKDGSVIWAALTVSLVRQPAGEPDYFIAVIQDLSPHKELEEQVRQQAAELEHHVAERTAALQEANAALEAFGYSVSHDLRAPLRNMQSLAQALDEDYGD